MKHAKIFCRFSAVFRPFRNGTFQKNSCLQKLVLELKAKDEKGMFRYAFKNSINN